jgi:HEPN domain-containing protein
MNATQRAYYLDFVTRSFRDLADKDYIGARVLYRYNLGPQFLWAAMQAVEKYLKGILLYNDESTKSMGHNLDKSYRALSKITDVPIALPEDVQEFISYLNQQGNNRYLEKHAYTTGNELLMLDRTVWFVRRYCQNIRGHSSPGPDGKRIDMFPLNVAALRAFNEGQETRYRIFGGFLEKVLQQRDPALRRCLVWKNFYYGKYRKKAIKHFTTYSWSENPAHYLHPEVFSILEERVKFPKEVIVLFRDHMKKTGHSL